MKLLVRQFGDGLKAPYFDGRSRKTDGGSVSIASLHRAVSSGQVCQK